MIPAVVDASWLGRPGVVAADVRWYLDGRSGRDAYLAGHIPGAVFVDLDRALAGPPSPAEGRHPLPAPGQFAAAMSAIGIGDDSVVVAYDDAGGLYAARLVWMLRALGHDAALLDGGLAPYDGDLATVPSGEASAAFTAAPWPAASLADVEDACSPAHLVIDARAPARFRGEEEPIDARAGHIPGARNLPATDNLDPSTGRFLPPGELRDRFASAGVGAGSDVVSYCGSGVTACHNLLALERAGLGGGRLYPGSWSQYSNMPDKPIATG